MQDLKKNNCSCKHKTIVNICWNHFCNLSTKPGNRASFRNSTCTVHCTFHCSVHCTLYSTVGLYRLCVLCRYMYSVSRPGRLESLIPLASAYMGLAISFGLLTFLNDQIPITTRSWTIYHYAAQSSENSPNPHPDQKIDEVDKHNTYVKLRGK